MTQKFIWTHVYRERSYWHNARHCVWYEQCPVIGQTAKFITVESKNYDTIHYPGGIFKLSIEKLQRDGVHHHTRHGEGFYLEKPKQGDLFPTQQLINTETALDYEARAIGWDMDKPMYELEEWQRDCYLIAMSLEQPLRKIIDRWKMGGQSEVNKMFVEIRQYKAEKLKQMILKAEDS